MSHADRSIVVQENHCLGAEAARGRRCAKLVCGVTKALVWRRAHALTFPAWPRPASASCRRELRRDRSARLAAQKRRDFELVLLARTGLVGDPAMCVERRLRGALRRRRLRALAVFGVDRVWRLRPLLRLPRHLRARLKGRRLALMRRGGRAVIDPAGAERGETLQQGAPLGLWMRLRRRLAAMS